MKSFHVSRYLPFLDSLKGYKQKDLKGDLSAGLTVGVMLIPQGMAYAMIAGLPPIYGLYASTLPLFIYAFLGSSRHLAVGPVAMVSLLTASGIGALAEAGTETYIQLAIALAFFVGTIQFILGVFRLGFLVNFLSHPVISGFTSAAALIIGISQLKHLLGMDIPRSHFVHETITYALTRPQEINWPTLLIGLASIVLIGGLKKWRKSAPAALIAVLAGILVVKGFSLVDVGVQIVGEVPKGLPSFSVPMIGWTEFNSILPIALAIALVSFMESIAVAKAVQSKHKTYQINPNQELIALGMANMAGSFAQSYPVTGGFSRTAVNDQAGAKSVLATVFSASLIVLTLLFFTHLFFYLPNAILAAVIMVAVFGLIDIAEARHLWRSDRSDFWMLAATFLATLGLGIEQGIGIGVVLSLSMMVYRTTRPHIAVLGKVPGSDFYRNKDRFEDVDCPDDVLIVRFDAEMYFANIQYFKDSLDRLEAEKGDQLKTVIINADSINHMDSTAVQMVNELVVDHRNRGIDVFFTGVIGPVRDALEKGHVTEKIGPQCFFMSVDEAVRAANERKGSKESGTDYPDYVLQTNE